MDVEVTDVNGGNAEVARDVDDPGVAAETPTTVNETVQKEVPVHTTKMDDEVNGDVKSVSKKSITPVARRKLEKFKANSTSTIDSDSKAKGQKRKLSEPDGVISDNSMDFAGFDKNNITLEPAVTILQKLIAEAEAFDLQSGKRMRRSLSKGPRRNIEFKTVDDHSGILDSSDMKVRLDESVDPLDIPKFKKESEKSDIESDHLKNEDTTGRSPSNKSPMGTNRQRGVKGGSSPASAVKQKSVNVTNSLFREPFKYGWKRELLYIGDDENALERTIKIFYLTPKGKRVRNLREVAEFLNTKELTLDNFTFIKEPTGVNDPEYEIIKEEGTVSTPVATPGRKMGSVGKRGGIARRMAGKLSPSPPAKGTGKFAQAKAATPGVKAKVPAKRGPQKKDVSPPKESDVLAPWSNSTGVTRRSHANMEKLPYKGKRSLKRKLQEPCSIRCSMSMGLIPSLQCCVCLCLYHPECVGHQGESANEDYVCKNCRQDAEEPKKSNASMTPPPLIPISMINSQNSKSRYSATIDQVSSSRQKCSRLENPETFFKNAGKPKNFSSNLLLSNKSDNLTPWFPRAQRDYILGQDEPKPAQNIAVLAGKRYIVVPKNNAGAVQPAITLKSNKIPNHSLIKDENIQRVEKNASEQQLQPVVVEKSPKRTEKKDKEKYENEEKVKEAEGETETERLLEKKDEKLAEKSKEDEKPNDSHTEINDGKQEVEYQEIGQTEEKTSAPMSIIDSCLETLEKIHEATISLEIIDKTMMSDASSNDGGNTSGEESEEGIVKVKKRYYEIKETLNSTSNEKSTSNHAEIIVTPIDDIKKAAPPVVEVDQRQYFMATVCAGYNALSRVFQYLKVQELLRAARVCKMWRDLAAHPVLWKTVRMKNSQVTDWDGLAASLQRHGTQHLDLRKMLIAGESDGIWKKFVSVISTVATLTKLELCRCPVMVVEEVIKACPRLQVLSAMSIKCEWLNLDAVGNVTRCQELRLKAISGMSLNGDLTPLQNLTQLSHLSLTSVKELGKKKIEVLASLVNLETLELGECSDFPSKFGTAVLCKLTKLERLRLEKGQGTCCTFDILNGVAKLDKLQQLELVNFDVKNGFDKRLANCKNIKRLLIIPTYISQSATSNNMVLGGVTELSNSLTHFVWGVTLELLRVTELFVDQCNQMNKQVSGDSIPVLKPVPCLKLIETSDENDPQKGDEKALNLPTPQVDILPLPQLQKLLLTALPKTRVKILKIPFHATWRQSIADTSSP